MNFLKKSCLGPKHQEEKTHIPGKGEKKEGGKTKSQKKHSQTLLTSLTSTQIYPKLTDLGCPENLRL